ncbi:MAG: GAF domain-containing protein [Steroidobacteraceae bacterium]
MSDTPEHQPLHATIDFHDKAAGYRELDTTLRALLAGERDLIANLANAAALLYYSLPELNWAGFYLMRETQGRSELVLGPFQGKTACVRIALGRGVCGTAAASRTTQLVTDVHAFPGHIACDSASNSEIVVPLIYPQGPRRGELLGVLDLDSPRLGRFDEIDRRGLETFAATLMSLTD